MTMVLSKATAVFTAYPWTMACWVLMSSIAAASKGVMCVQGTSNSNYQLLFINTATPTLECAPGGVDASATANVTTSTWAHLCAVGISTVSRAMYVNGGNVGTNTTSETAPTLTNTQIGNCTVIGGTNMTNGVVAFPAYWSMALSVSDIGSLAVGASPKMIHPEKLISYCRMDGNSPETDFVSSTGYTVTAAPAVSANTRIYKP